MTLEELNLVPAGEIFACGELPNSEEGLFMTNTDAGRMLRWIAKKDITTGPSIANGAINPSIG